MLAASRLILPINKMCNMRDDNVLDVRHWIDSHALLSSKYVSLVKESHPALWFTSVMREIEKAIDNKEQDAVDLGCFYVTNTKKSPFGKIHQCNILVRLKRNKELIKEHFIPMFIRTLEEYRLMKYPPREVKQLTKLIEAFK